MSAAIASTGAGSSAGWSDRPLMHWGREHPLLFWWSVAIVLGVVSGIVWPTIPSYDPFSWVVWGHSVSSSSIPFYIGDGPSWKPLPFFFTTIYGLFGGAAPWLWVVTARIGGIAGLAGAGRLCWMLCDRAGLPRWTAPVAGFVAIVGIVLSWNESLWTYYFFRGTSEVFLIGVWIWALERLFTRHHWQAFALIALEGWMRPEAWPFLLVYGAYLFWRHPAMRIWVVVWIVSQPVAWFVPPWISTGQPLLAANHASEYNGDLGANPLKTVLERGESLQSLPSLILGFLASLGALWFGRGLLLSLARLWRRPSELLARLSEADERSPLPMLLTLAAASAAWWVVVVVETEDHYPGLQRFYLPAAAMICVLSGYALVQIIVWIARIVPASRSIARLAFALVLVAATFVGSWHWLSPRWTLAKQQEPLAAQAVSEIHDLGRSVALLGGRARILPCASSVVTINHSMQTVMGWELGTDLSRVPTVLSRPGLAWVGPHNSIDGGQPDIHFNFEARTIAQVGVWSIQQVYRPGTRPGPCVGS